MAGLSGDKYGEGEILLERYMDISIYLYFYI